jgi:hypothetical protein
MHADLTDASVHVPYTPVRAPIASGAEPLVAPRGVLAPSAIAERAFALFEDRGRTDGHDVDDWLEAERQLLHELAGPLGRVQA